MPTWRLSGRPGRRPRICIVRQNDLYEPMIQREAEALARDGYEVEVLCMRYPGRPRRTVVNDVTVTSLPASRTKSNKLRYLFDYAWFFALTAATVTARHLCRPYAAIQVNTMPDFLVFAAAVPKAMGCRVVAYMHEPSPELTETLYGPGRLVRVMEVIEQAVLRFADHAITVTPQLKERYVECGADADRITVVLNCVSPETLLCDLPEAPHRSNDEFVIVSHGTIEERYGQEDIVAAAQLLRDELPNLRVVLTGRGSRVDELVRSIEHRGLQDVVRFEGWVDLPRLNEILLSADAGIVAQRASPYSQLVQTNKMVDYWIIGIPVIASRLRSVAEMYDESVIEYYEPGDPEALADAIRHLYHTPGRREELARNGRLAHEAQGWAVQRTAYLGVYKKLLTAPSAKTRSALPASGRTWGNVGSEIGEGPADRLGEF